MPKAECNVIILKVAVIRFMRLLTFAALAPHAILTCWPTSRFRGQFKCFLKINGKVDFVAPTKRFLIYGQSANRNCWSENSTFYGDNFNYCGVKFISAVTTSLVCWGFNKTFCWGNNVIFSCNEEKYFRLLYQVCAETSEDCIFLSSCRNLAFYYITHNAA